MRAVVFCFALVSSALGTAFTDMNCTNGDSTTPTFVATATVCEDKYATAVCTQLFGTAVVPLGTTDRDAKCNTDANGISEDMKQVAIASCAKSCGYCCETPEYNSEGKMRDLSQAQCKDSTWRPILAEDCPAVCGLCLEGGCVDAVIECKNDPAVCRQVDMQDFVKTNCQRTCGYCPSSTTAATTAAPAAAVTQAATAATSAPAALAGQTTAFAKTSSTLWTRGSSTAPRHATSADRTKYGTTHDA
ncbi:shTK domain protein [Oesophagostomum dentatum]|uniref:ShTK domain protein n=1 Tax=Oesophagostomum dentatum TaxID=61180 RepID=A0A0B1RWQ1_OESDE|nr:shTK domain protein [Oesophagostomum dentatum]